MRIFFFLNWGLCTDVRGIMYEYQLSDKVDLSQGRVDSSVDSSLTESTLS